VEKLKAELVLELSKEWETEVSGAIPKVTE
jgi:hypothetical protein